MTPTGTPAERGGWSPCGGGRGPGGVRAPEPRPEDILEGSGRKLTTGAGCCAPAARDRRGARDTEGVRA